MCFLLLAGAAQAQTPPDCTTTCNVRLEGFSYQKMVEGCGNHATPSRFKLILSSTNANVTRASFKTLIDMTLTKDASHGGGNAFNDLEWRGGSRSSWNDLAPGNYLQFAGGTLGENIIEMRPKAGARIWSRAGDIVVPVFYPRRSSGNRRYTTDQSNRIHFFFMGGKGCARVGRAGGLLGGNQ